MLVPCPNCRVEFSPSLRTCPTCGKYEPPFEVVRDHFLRQTMEAIAAGASDAKVREIFIARGLADAEADEHVTIAKRQSRGANRRSGISHIAQGILFLLLSGFLWLLSYAVTRGFVTLFFYGLFAIGVGFLVAGIYQWLTGRRVE